MLLLPSELDFSHAPGTSFTRQPSNSPFHTSQTCNKPDSRPRIRHPFKVVWGPKLWHPSCCLKHSRCIDPKSTTAMLVYYMMKLQWFQSRWHWHPEKHVLDGDSTTKPPTLVIGPSTLNPLWGGVSMSVPLSVPWSRLPCGNHRWDSPPISGVPSKPPQKSLRLLFARRWHSLK